MEKGDVVISKDFVEVIVLKKVVGTVYKTDVDLDGDTIVYFETTDGELKCFKEKKLNTVCPSHLNY